MKKSEFYNIILVLTLLILNFGCSKNEISLDEYSKKLQINFPKNAALIYSNTHSDMQDYSIQSVYKLSFNQKNILLDEIIKNLCDSSNEDNKNSLGCWHMCDAYFSYKYRDNDIGLEIDVVFVANNDFSTLNIYEVKL